MVMLSGPIAGELFALMIAVWTCSVVNRVRVSDVRLQVCRLVMRASELGVGF